MMFRLPWMILCVTFVACAARTGGGVMADPLPLTEVWVVATPGRSGDGSEARPFTSLGQALALAKEGGPPLQVHLAPGRYPGPFVLTSGVELEGAEDSVLTGEGEGPVVRAPAGMRMTGGVIEGGAWGLVAGGTVRLEEVHFRGQSAGALRVEAGRLDGEGCTFEAGGAGTVGLRVEAGAHVELHKGAFTGPFRRGVEAQGAEVELENMRFEGALTALHQVEGRVGFKNVWVAEASEVGLFVLRGALRLEKVQVFGHEYGLQSLEATLDVRGLIAMRAARAGLALIGSHGTVTDVRVGGTGSFGGLSLVGSDLVLDHVVVEQVEAYGIAATRGRLLLHSGVIRGVTSREGDSGDGLHLRDVEVEVERLTVEDVEGSGVLAAQGARVELRNARLDNCREAGLWVETQARVAAGQLNVSRSKGPALVALEDGVLLVDVLTAWRDNAKLVVADCQGKTGISLGRVTGPGLQGAGVPPCVVSVSP